MAANRNRDGSKKITAGMRKAPGKLQKGLDMTENRIPGKPKMVTGISGTAKKPQVAADTKNSSTVIRGSNRKAAKGETPKNTPGVKKNKSLQRSINNSNKNLKDFKKPRGGMGGGGLFGGGAIRKSK
jgi:hypothetical protein